MGVIVCVMTNKCSFEVVIWISMSIPLVSFNFHKCIFLKLAANIEEHCYPTSSTLTPDLSSDPFCYRPYLTKTLVILSILYQTHLDFLIQAG